MYECVCVCVFLFLCLIAVLVFTTAMFTRLTASIDRFERKVKVLCVRVAGLFAVLVLPPQTTSFTPAMFTRFEGVVWWGNWLSVWVCVCVCVCQCLRVWRISAFTNAFKRFQDDFENSKLWKWQVFIACRVHLCRYKNAPTNIVFTNTALYVLSHLAHLFGLRKCAIDSSTCRVGTIMFISTKLCVYVRALFPPLCCKSAFTNIVCALFFPCTIIWLQKHANNSTTCRTGMTMSTYTALCLFVFVCVWICVCFFTPHIYVAAKAHSLTCIYADNSQKNSPRRRFNLEAH